MMNQITIENVGPIEHVTIPVPEGGGLVIFKGVNGSGKSIALDAIDAAVSGKGRVPVRDGQLHGEVQAHGVTLRLGRSTRRSGEAEVTSLEGRLSIADLVDPGIKAPEAADAHRIRALVSLAAGEPDITLFTGLLSEPEFEQIIGTDTRKSIDLVTMAGRVKRDVEAAARGAETTAENAVQEAEAAARMSEGSDPAWAKPEAEVDLALEKAIERRSKLYAETQAAERAVEVARQDNLHLQEAEARYQGPTLEAAVGHREDCGAKLREASMMVSVATSELKAAHDAAKAAEEHEAMTAAWSKSIKEGQQAQQVDNDEAYQAAVRDVDHCREAIKLASDGRIAQQQLDKMVAAKARAELASDRATHFRDAASGADEVLSQVIAESGIPVQVQPVNQQMRLVCRTDRGVTPFGELSPGERWRIALDIAAKALGAGGEITIPQHAWEAMDPTNQNAIVNQLKDTGIIAYTAVSSLGPLRAEVV